jgi:hypothetical protein
VRGKRLGRPFEEADDRRAQIDQVARRQHRRRPRVLPRDQRPVGGREILRGPPPVVAAREARVLSADEVATQRPVRGLPADVERGGRQRHAQAFLHAGVARRGDDFQAGRLGHGPIVAKGVAAGKPGRAAPRETCESPCTCAQACRGKALLGLGTHRAGTWLVRRP